MTNFILFDSVFCMLHYYDRIFSSDDLKVTFENPVNVGKTATSCVVVTNLSAIRAPWSAAVQNFKVGWLTSSTVHTLQRALKYLMSSSKHGIERKLHFQQNNHKPLQSTIDCSSVRLNDIAYARMLQQTLEYSRICLNNSAFA